MWSAVHNVAPSVQMASCFELNMCMQGHMHILEPQTLYYRLVAAVATSGCCAVAIRCVSVGVCACKDSHAQGCS
jgi:hypothetical protein